MRESTLIVDSSQQLDYLKCPIFLKQSVEPTGRYGRTLGVVFVNGMNVNLEMVKTGLAEVYRGRPAKGFNPQAEPQEVGQFLERVMGYHAQAYAYEAGERQKQIRRGAAEHLAMGVRNGRLSMRSVVRLAVELFDLLYLYPDYDIATLLDELRQQVR